ncbi:MAG: Elastase inhibitor AFLEI Flags: Precursor [Burkholderiales bacterium]|nr:MAG: Elastase inhibitor AFLEI Flags: Precursor [Burkholderiales bacterium]
MKNTFLAVVAGIALMACSPSTEPTPAAPVEPAAAAPVEPAPPVATPADPAMADTCNMAQYTALVGKPVTDAGVPAAGPSVRIIKPGDQVTMDFSEARLNIDVDAAGVITGMRCG